MPLSFHISPLGFYPDFLTTSVASQVETNFVSTVLYPVFYKHTVVEFAVPAEWGNCLFNVYRGDSAEGPFEKLNPTPFNSNFFKDTGERDYYKFKSSYYVVEVQLPDGRLTKGAPTTWEVVRHRFVELRSKEIQRREMLLLSKFTGVKALLFKRKYFGKRCPNCWNAEIEKITKDHCPVCIGTSFEGGYYPAFETFMQWDPTTNTTNLGEPGLVESNTLNAWTISMPKIDSLDVILRVPDMALFRVDQTQATELQTKTVRQIVTMTELSKNSIEFKLAEQAIPKEYL